MEKMLSRKVRVIAVIVIFFVIAFIMIVGTKHMSDPATYKQTIQSLNEKTKTVTMLTGISAGISTAITVIPDDIGTPVAEQLMNLNSSFVVVLIALFAEKCLLTLIGKVVCMFFFPMGFVFLAFGIWNINAKTIMKGLNVILASILLVVAVPAATWTSREIEKVYNLNLEEVVQSGEETKNQIQEVTGTADEKTEKDEENNNKDFISKAANTLSKKASEVFNTVTGVVSGTLNKGEEFLKKMTESLALMIVTNCVIPILTIFCFFWGIKCCMGLDLSSSLPLLYDWVLKVQKKAFRKTKNRDM